MADFALLKNLPNDADNAQNVGFGWVQNNNQVWASTSSQIMYSSDFGVSFNVVYEPSGTNKFAVWIYRYNNNTYAVAQVDAKFVWSKWNGASFTEFHTITSAGALKARLIKGDGTKVYFTGKLTSNLVVFIEQNGDIVLTRYTTGATGDAGGIVEFSGNIYWEFSTFPNGTVYKWDGAVITSQFSHASEWYGAFYNFGGTIYTYEQVNKIIYTINILTGTTSPVYVVSDLVAITARAYFGEKSGELNFILGKSTPPDLSFDGVRSYEFGGVTFTKVYENTSQSLGDLSVVDNELVFGVNENDFYESICSIEYNGESHTNETALDADDGTITHDVNTTNAVGTVYYRLLDDSEVEVVTWQVSPLFENLVPGNYLLESKDDECQIRFDDVVSILEFQVEPSEQVPSRTRDPINSPNFTRFYQIFGMTLGDFQALDGELPPPIDEVNDQSGETFYRITSDGDVRITSTGDIRRWQ